MYQNHHWEKSFHDTLPSSHYRLSLYTCLYHRMRQHNKRRYYDKPATHFRNSIRRRNTNRSNSRTNPPKQSSYNNQIELSPGALQLPAIVSCCTTENNQTFVKVRVEYDAASPQAQVVQMRKQVTLVSIVSTREISLHSGNHMLNSLNLLFY